MANLIKVLRVQKGLTQEELGDYLGVKKSAIQKYESGAIINLKADTIIRLAKLFNVPPAYFVYSEAEMDNDRLHREVVESCSKLNFAGLHKTLDYIKDLERIGDYRK